MNILNISQVKNNLIPKFLFFRKHELNLKLEHKTWLLLSCGYVLTTSILFKLIVYTKKCQTKFLKIEINFI